jgi:hypothetical protein
MIFAMIFALLSIKLWWIDYKFDWQQALVVFNDKQVLKQEAPK